MPSDTRAAWRTWTVRAMVLFAALYVVALAVRATGWGPPWAGWMDSLVDGWLGVLTLWAPVAVCGVAVQRAGLRRPEVLLAAASVTSYALGDTYYVAMTAGYGALTFPSLADVGYLLVYPLMLAAVIVPVRRYARGLAPSVWLDCAVGSLGASAVLAVVLAPVLDSATSGPLSLGAIVAVSPPVFDLALVAAIAGTAALGGVRLGTRWALLVGGLVVFTATDIIYGLEVTAGTYVQGTPLDSGWAIGLAVMAMWVDNAAHGEKAAQQDPLGTRRTRAVAVSSAATAAGVAVLVLGTRVHVSILAVTLAGATLLAATARSELATRLLARMADQRLLAAATDDLTGLPNRRALYDEARLRLAEPRHRQALLLLDVDKFKDVNDSMGHGVGDQLLVQLGARLRENLRGDDLLARLGGDEFAVLLDDAGQEEAVKAAVRLCGAAGQPFLVYGSTLEVSVSIGIALTSEDAIDLSALLREADIAMYKAKTLLTGHHVYGVADETDARGRHAVLAPDSRTGARP